MADRISIKTTFVEEEPIVGDWFWSEEEASVDSETCHTSRPRAKEEQVSSFCLGSGKKSSMESGPKATSKSLPVAKEDEVVIGSWFGQMMKRSTYRLMTSLFLDLGSGALVRTALDLLESIVRRCRRLEKKKLLIQM